MIEKNKIPTENIESKHLRTIDPAAKPVSENENFEEIPDLDGDGLIGDTGGNYGDTTYTGGSLIQPQPEPLQEVQPISSSDEEDKNEGR